MAENNVIPFEAEASKGRTTNHTRKSSLQSKSIEATWKQKSSKLPVFLLTFWKKRKKKQNLN